MLSSEHAHKRIKLTVMVHVIEARHLVGKDSNRLSDPFVRVTVAGKRQVTDIRRNQINATWDQVFMFQDLDLSIEEYESELIVLQVFDANIFFPNELIGQYSFGLSKVRAQPPPTRHQVYRKWLVLTNPKDPLEEQGYLQATVTVLGPGDIPPSHERQDDFVISSSGNQQHKEERVLRAPEVQRRGYNFTVKIFRGEHLPITDTWNRTSDPFVVVKFNGVVARTPHQAKTTTPNWNYLLSLPVFTPCFSDTIEIQLFDYVRGQPDRLLATKRLKFTSLLGESFPPSWFNFYGRVDEDNSSSGWICDVVRATKSDIDATAYMGRILMALNTTLTDQPALVDKPCAPIKGPKTTKYVLWVDVYCASELPFSWLGGKAMVEVQFGPSENHRVSDWCAMEEGKNSLGNNDGDEEEDIFESDVFKKETNNVRFTCSGENLHGAQGDESAVGFCQFKEIGVTLPFVQRSSTSEHVSSQLYDIILNVYIKTAVGPPARVGYLRIKPNDVWGFNNPPEWHSLQGLVNRQGQTSTAGQILVSCSFGLADQKRQSPREPMKIDNKGKLYQLRAYIYQARNLTPTNKNGLASTSVRVSLGGKTAVITDTSNKDKLKDLFKYRKARRAAAGDYNNAKDDENNPGGSFLFDPKRIQEMPESLHSTSEVPNSLHPIWYETLTIDKVRLPDPLSLAPDIEIRVTDDTNLSSGDFVGRVKFPAGLCTPDLWPLQKRPRWLKLGKTDLTKLRKDAQVTSTSSTFLSHLYAQENNVQDLDADNHAGDILVQLQLIEYEEELPHYPVWAHSWPRVVPCVLHLGTVGLRGLEEYGIFFSSIDKPYVRVSCQSIPNMAAPSTIAAFAVKDKVLSTPIDDDDELIVNGSNAKGTDESSNQNDYGDGETGDDGFSLAKQEMKRFEEPPFARDYDKQGRLPARWLNASNMIRLNAERLLATFTESTPRFPNLFHPFGQGEAFWSNKVDEEALKKEQERKRRKKRNKNQLEEGDDVDDMADEDRDGLDEDDIDMLDDAQDLEEKDLEKGERAKQPVISAIEKERKRLTFFQRAELHLNMPLDPFYAPSLTIQVMDERFLGDETIATTTVNTREFASALLYTEAMKQKAASKESLYEIPRFAMGTEAYEELRRIAWEESDDEEDVALEEEEENKNELTVQDLLVASSGNNNKKSNKVGKFGMLDGNSPVDSTSPTHSDVAFTGFDETFYDNSAEGHYTLPLTLPEDIDEMNNEFEDNEEINMLAKSDEDPQSGDGDLERKDGIIWEQPDESDLHLGSTVLEENPEMQPYPFTSFKLYRGTQVDRMLAGVFKALVVINPFDPELLSVFRVKNDFRPALGENGEPIEIAKLEGDPRDLRYLAVRENELIQFDRGDDRKIAGYAIKYRPGKIEKGKYGVVPRECVEEIPDPLIDLKRSPDVKIVNDADSHSVRPRIHPISDGRVQRVKVRVYVVACSQLPARSAFKNSDPYLVVQLKVPPHLKDSKNGTTYHNDRANYKPNTLDPYFGTWFELDATFPDIHELEVQVWNANYLTDELIGSTKIDLEDRYFNKQWHELKYERKKIKEFRPLTNPGSKLTQGIAEMWVEIFRPEEAIAAPIVDIRAPKTEVWELRVVVWETRRVPLVDDHTYANLYVTGELHYESLDSRFDGDQYYSTDTHTGLKDGRGIFNFRMKFSLEAPCKFPRLKLKVWERWLLSHTNVGEADIDLTRLVREASRSQKDVIDRTRVWVPLSHSNSPGEINGELDIQMSLVTAAYAEANLVGQGRDPPNENPFLPDPPRESFFAQAFRSVGWGKSIGCILCLVITLVIILVIIFK